MLWSSVSWLMLFLRDLIHSVASFITSAFDSQVHHQPYCLSWALVLNFLWPVRHFHLDIMHILHVWNWIHICWNSSLSNIPFSVHCTTSRPHSKLLSSWLLELPGSPIQSGSNLIHSFLTMSLAAVPFHFYCHYAHLHPYQLTQDYNSLINLTAS